MYQWNVHENKSFTLNDKKCIYYLDGHESEIFTLNENTNEDEIRSIHSMKTHGFNKWIKIHLMTIFKDFHNAKKYILNCTYTITTFYQDNGHERKVHT